VAYFRPPQPGQRIQAVPGAGLNVPIYVLGSSLFGAQVAAALGLPYAFASHFASVQQAFVRSYELTAQVRDELSVAPVA